MTHGAIAMFVIAILACLYMGYPWFAAFFCFLLLLGMGA